MFGFGKGKIEIQLEKINFSPGETINGHVVLDVKKPTKAREFRIVFEGIKTTKDSIGAGEIAASAMGIGMRKTRSSTKRTIIHSFKVSLDGEKNYSGINEYDFQIKIPKNVLPQKQDTGLGTALNVFNSLAGISQKIDWQIKATLDIPGGFDINKIIQITVE